MVPGTSLCIGHGRGSSFRFPESPGASSVAWIAPQSFPAQPCFFMDHEPGGEAEALQYFAPLYGLLAMGIVITVAFVLIARAFRSGLLEAVREE